MTELGWWVLHGKVLLDVLRRVKLGESLDIVYAELYANSDTEYIPPKNKDIE